MDEKNLNELKFYFGVGMSKHSTQGRNMIESTWENIVKTYNQRHYHNLSLVYSDLDTARKLDCSIPEEVIIASVLQYLKFSPSSSANHIQETSNHVSFFLKTAFGWRDKKVREILELIVVGNKIVLPSSSEPYAARLMYDMKTSRFAKTREDFAKDRLNASTEYKNISNEAFIRAEHGFLICQSSKDELFSLKQYKPLTAQARDNIGIRLVFLNKRIADMERHSDT